MALVMHLVYISWMKSSKLSKFHSSELSKFHTKIGVSTIEIDFCLLIFSSEKILEKRLFRELLWCWRSFTFRVDKLIWVPLQYHQEPRRARFKYPRKKIFFNVNWQIQTGEATNPFSFWQEIWNQLAHKSAQKCNKTDQFGSWPR